MTDTTNNNTTTTTSKKLLEIDDTDWLVMQLTFGLADDPTEQSWMLDELIKRGVTVEQASKTHQRIRRDLNEIIPGFDEMLGRRKEGIVTEVAHG